MKKYYFILIFSFLGINVCSAQTLFTYGKYNGDARDFLRAYNKNNNQAAAKKARAMSDYLDLYIKSRLKIREAYERKIDTLPSIKSEIENLRMQIVDNYMADPEVTARMTKEAFQRSQKDIHVAHIFIGYRNAAGLLDSAAAAKKRDDLLARLKKAEDFAALAKQFSDDTSARQNGGDLGYITVFTLPYEFENAVYATPAGKYSNIVISKTGYHVFKIIESRKAIGKIKAQQILLSIPPGSDDPYKKQISAKADSIYKRILAGDNFNKLATELSTDYLTAAAGGQMQEAGVGQFDPVFEKVLFSLPKDGAVSKPFLTSHGWHIVKRNSRKPVVANAADKDYQSELEQKVKADSRWKTSKDFISQRIKARPGYRKYEYNDAALWNMSDSMLNYQPMTTGRSIQPNTPLFSIGDTIYDANDWLFYANTFRFKSNGSGAKPWEQVREEWTQYLITNYYKDHLEEYNAEFRAQMMEFKEGNLFFEIMQQEIWNKAQNDSVALLSLYEKNKKHYTWKQSADAILFFCSDINIARDVYEKVKENPANWQKITEQFSDKVIGDSSRYEWDQVPNIGKTVPKKGMFTSPLLNSADNTASFAYIVNVYPQPMQRSYHEARGLVINDYQLDLEKKWDDILMKKYPVTIDKKVLADISK